MGSNITRSYRNSNYGTAATIYTLQEWVVSGIV